MTHRNMNFEVVLEPFKEISPEIWIEDAGQTAHINYGGGTVGIASVECCGWLEVSNLKGGTKADQENIYKILTVLMNEDCIYSEEAADWNDDEEPVKFPLFCVTTNNKVAEWLKENNWQPLKPFVNPNTLNTCMPFYWHS